MDADMKASIHRFRLRRCSPSPSRASAAGRARSASPTRSPDQLPPVPPSGAAGTTTGSPSHPKSRNAAAGAAGATGRSMVPACDRCRSFKKKCSRTYPVCTLCANAGQKCSYTSPLATAEVQAHQFRERVQWLSRYINEHLMTPDREGGIEAVETGSDLAAVLGLPSDRPNSAGRPPLSFIRGAGGSANTPPSDLQTASDAVGEELRLLGGGAPSLIQQQQQQSMDVDVTLGDDNLTSPLVPGSVGPTGSHMSYQDSVDESARQSGNNGFITRQALPQDAAARRFVDAYFRHVHRAYPFVNQAKIRRDLENLSVLSQRPRDPTLTLLYLVMAIGCRTLERAGQIPSETARRFDVAYSDIIQECLTGASVESVQILVLLALYSLFDPKGASAYSIVGIAARQAMVLGLTRRAPDEHVQPPAETERKNRLYWSIFVLDRMMSVSQGLPVALIDENASIPLPGLMVEEFASTERTTFARNLQTSRHVIQLRQLEDRILQQVHFRRRSDSAAMTPGDRRAVLGSIRADIEDWYSSGCLMSPMEADNVPIHSSITWLSARYYQLLLLLYYPNHFNGAAAAVSRSELLQFVRKQLQSTSVLLQQRQLPLNSVTLCRLFPVCLVLMHEFAASSSGSGSSDTAEWATAQSKLPFAARDEVAVLVSVLEAFPEGWTVARRAVQVVQQFAGIITTGGMTAYFTMKQCITDLTVLMQEVLGQATCFQFIEFPSAHLEACDVTVVAQQPMASSLMFNDTSVTEQVTVGNDDSVLSYGWGPWDMDLL